MERTTARTESSAPPQVREWALFALAVLVCVAVLVFRKPDAFTAPWFYAEEGRDFLADAYRDGWASLGYRANGYFHFYPRLVANLGLSTGVPIEGMPWLNLSAELLMYVVVWAYTFFRLPTGPARHALGAWWRCIAVLATVIPPLGNEVWMNMTNVQWPMALLIPLIVLGRRPKSPVWRSIDVVFLGLACSTGPYALVFAPVVLMAWWQGRKAEMPNGSQVQYGIVALAAGVQLLALISYGSVQRTQGEFDPLHRGFLQEVFFQLWYPVLSVGVRSVPFWLRALLTVGGIAFLYIACRKTREASVLLLCAALLVITTLISYRGAPDFLSPFDSAIRNFYLPTVLLAWALASVPWPNPERATVTAAAVLCWWSVQTVVFIGPERFPRPVPVIDQAALDQGRAMEVPIDPPGWTMRLVRIPSQDAE